MVFLGGGRWTEQGDIRQGHMFVSHQVHHHKKLKTSSKDENVYVGFGQKKKKNLNKMIGGATTLDGLIRRSQLINKRETLKTRGSLRLIVWEAIM